MRLGAAEVLISTSAPKAYQRPPQGASALIQRILHLGADSGLTPKISTPIYMSVGAPRRFNPRCSHAKHDSRVQFQRPPSRRNLLS